MPLAAGQTLSYYEILGPLGVGAMGEVYRATDTRLEREVAIKVLPEEFAADEERLQRFEREARALASLNHPNVAQIYGVDQVGDLCFLVLELVPGQTLEERIERGPLPVEEAAEVAQQIAAGLEAAHEAGVIHRDLKPANVRLTPDGRVKVLDFGLAKSRRGEDGQASSSDSVLSTERGRLLGTPTYMAPEQARGVAIDRRVDVWAFGCVLYECLTGERAFSGETVSDVLAAVLQTDVDLERLPSATPAHVRSLVGRCLEKDPQLRLRDVGDAGLLLASSWGLPEQAPTPARDGSKRALAYALAALVLGLLLGSLWPREASEAPRGTMLSIHVPEEFAVRIDGAPVLALSPDGRTLAWVGGTEGHLYVRSLDSFEIRALPATENAVAPFFSPDSQRLGFWKEGALMSIPLGGGAPSKIADVPTKPRQVRGASWGDDGTIVLTPSISGGLFRVDESGGELEALTTLAADSDVRTHRYPQVLPGARTVIFTSDDKRTTEYHDDASIVALSMETGEQVVVLEGAGMARYAAGHLVYVREADLHAIAFDPETLETVGESRRIVAGVECQTMQGVAYFDLALDGTLAYEPGLDRAQETRLAWRSPGMEPDVWDDLRPAPYENPRVSPDGAYVAYLLQGSDVPELWLYSVERRVPRRLMRRNDILTPIWGANSDRLYIGSGLAGDPVLQEVSIEGATPGATRDVYAGEPGSFLTPAYAAPDGRTLLAVTDDKSGQVDIVGVDLASGEAHDVLATPEIESQPVLDSSGEWMALARFHDGEIFVYLTSAEPGGPMLQVSHQPGRDPRWAADDQAIYYLREGARELWEVEVELGEEPQLGESRLLLDDFYWDEVKQWHYDVGPDGRVLTLVDFGGSELGREIRVRSDWIEAGGASRP